MSLLCRARVLWGVLPLVFVGSMSARASAQCTGFSLSSSSGATIVPGTTDVGNHCDDCTTSVTLPFAVSLYGAPYTTVNLSSNGNAQFSTASTSFSNACLTASGMGVAIFPHWDDLRTDGTGNGIFTSTTGTAPNRVFNIEWRTVYFSGPGSANFELRLFEDNSHFEVIYANVTGGGASATVGVQHTTLPASQFECNSGGTSSGVKLSFACTNNPIPPVGTGAAAPSNVFACGSSSTTLLTVAVTPGASPPSTGIAVNADLTSIGGASNQTFYDDATHGDVTAGDSTFSYRATVGTSVTPGSKSFTFNVTDAQGRSSAGGFGITVSGCPTSGPDVYVGTLVDVANYGATGNITAYAVGTDACNAGDSPVNWISGGTQHPVIAQNMFRLKNGRFEQLGQSWLKHGFASTNSNACGTCVQPPGGGSQLGVNCSDTYGSGLNGSQGGLGPRSQVNSTTGVFPTPSGPSYDPTIGRRLQVFTADIDPAQNAGARYFVEGHYVTADDAQWTTGSVIATNGLNNSSYREINNLTASNPGFVSTTQQQKPGIQAWKDVDSSVSLVTTDYTDTTLIPAGIRARFWVAGKATNNGNGTWHYEYAVYNHNADRCGGALTIPIGPGALVSNIGFHGVFAHSGEPYPNTAANLDNWPGAVANLAVSWHTPEAFSGNGDNANALRWGTMYNFRFDATVAPVAAGSGTLGLFKPGTPTSLAVAGIPVPGHGCIADFDDGSGSGRPDGGVTIDDLLYYLAVFDQGVAQADVDDGTGTGTPDGGVTIDDLLYYLARFDAGC